MMRLSKERLPTIAAAIEFGRQAAEAVTLAINKPPVCLEFEKVYVPFLLMSKKRYSGLKWEEADKPVGVVSMGTEAKRRDNCKLASELLQAVGDRLLLHNDRDGAIALVIDTLQRLHNGQIDLGKLVITKELARDKYAGPQPHVEVAQKMRARDPSSAPNLGERVPYVVVSGARGSNICQNAEDPIFVMEHGLTPDSSYYIEHQLRKPLERLLDPVIGDRAIKRLFADAGRKITRKMPKTFALQGFVVQAPRCLNCPSPALNGTPLCRTCAPSAQAIYASKMYAYREAERRHWAYKRRCEECSQLPAQCRNIDCDAFFQRTSVQRDIEDLMAALDRFKGVK